ncbi:MAG: hypothetical protein U0N82_06455, partial [Oscillospiraceae bacterium]
SMIAGGNHTIVYALRSAPLADFFWSFSCSATRKGHYRTVILTERYTILQQHMEKESFLWYTVYNYVLQERSCVVLLR